MNFWRFCNLNLRVDELIKSDAAASEKTNQLEKRKRQLSIQLDVLREFYAQHDMKVRQELAKEKELRSNIEGDLKTFADREQFMNREIDEYKTMRKELLQKRDAATIDRKQSVNVNNLELFEHFDEPFMNTFLKTFLFEIFCMNFLYELLYELCCMNFCMNFFV